MRPHLARRTCDCRSPPKVHRPPARGPARPVASRWSFSPFSRFHALSHAACRACAIAHAGGGRAIALLSIARPKGHAQSNLCRLRMARRTRNRQSPVPRVCAWGGGGARRGLRADGSSRHCCLERGRGPLGALARCGLRGCGTRLGGEGASRPMRPCPGSIPRNAWASVRAPAPKAATSVSPRPPRAPPVERSRPLAPVRTISALGYRIVV